jgi:DNA-binding beta-propeller fold protein YncE
MALAVLVVAFGASGAEAAPFVYVANRGSDDVSQYDAFGGRLSPLSPFTVPAGRDPNLLAVSPDGANVYVTNVADNSVSQYSVGARGALTPNVPPTVAARSIPIAVAVSPDSSSVYVTNGDVANSEYSVSQYSVGASGILTPKSPPRVATGTNPRGIVVSVDGRSVYVANVGILPSEGSLGQYSVGAGGVLTPKSPPAVGVGRNPSDLAVSPDGQNVYAVSIPNSTVSQYSVGAGGRLTFRMALSTGRAPFGVAITLDGKSIYVTNEFDNAVAQYSVGSGGALSAKSPATVPTGESPIGVAVSPDGRSVYVTNLSSDNVSQYDVGPSGLLSPKSPATVAAGSLPEGVAVGPPARTLTNKGQCKEGGWRNFPGFKNQGDCVSFVATGGKNPPAG